MDSEKMVRFFLNRIEENLFTGGGSGDVLSAISDPLYPLQTAGEGDMQAMAEATVVYLVKEFHLKEAVR